MLTDVKEIIFAMNKRRKYFRKEADNLKKVQMKILEYKYRIKIHWMDLE